MSCVSRQVHQNSSLDRRAVPRLAQEVPLLRRGSPGALLLFAGPLPPFARPPSPGARPPRLFARPLRRGARLPPPFAPPLPPAARPLLGDRSPSQPPSRAQTLARSEPLDKRIRPIGERAGGVSTVRRPSRQINSETSLTGPPNVAGGPVPAGGYLGGTSTTEHTRSGRTGLVGGSGSGGGAWAEFRRSAAAVSGRSPADAGGAGRGGGAEPAVGQRPGAWHQSHRAQGHRAAARRCAWPDRAGAGAVRGGGARAGTGRGRPCRRKRGHRPRPLAGGSAADLAA